MTRLLDKEITEMLQAKHFFYYRKNKNAPSGKISRYLET